MNLVCTKVQMISPLVYKIIKNRSHKKSRLLDGIISIVMLSKKDVTATFYCQSPLLSTTTMI